MILYFVMVVVMGAFVRHLPASSILSAVSALAVGTAHWLCIPYILLARRIAIRRLLPGAVVTAIAVAVLSVGMSIYMPRSISSHTQHFGPIGVVVALLYWFLAAALVVVAAAVAGNVYDRSRVDAGKGEASEPIV